MRSHEDRSDIEPFLHDSSNSQAGHAEAVYFPKDETEVATILREASAQGRRVTIAGAGTGIVGGRVPEGGIVVSTQNLRKITEVRRNGNGGHGIAQAGVTLGEFAAAAQQENLFYPPDPTEWSCSLGGTVATNASGARTFKYGPTRNYIRRLKIVLPQGDIIDLNRGEIFADRDGKLTLPLPSGGAIVARLPTYSMPKTRKHVSGYFVAPGMDLIDLFIGSEGTLGFITEIEASMLEKPENVLAGIVFFPSSEGLLSFVEEARSRSLSTWSGDVSSTIDARALEYFDERALNFLRSRYPNIPTEAAGAIFFEQEMDLASEDEIFSAWMNLIEEYGALADDSWFAMNDADRNRLKEFRHALPVMVNEWLVHHGQRKVSTDMAVPNNAFRSMLDFYNSRLAETGLEYVIFGHIGDCHLHVNILPRNDQEAGGARSLYREFIERAVALGGTVSAEHGIGKLKREYLETLYGKDYVREMAELKKAFDPARVLGIGNLFSDSYL